MFKGREMTDYLADILTAIAEIEDFTHGMNYEEGFDVRLESGTGAVAGG